MTAISPQRFCHACGKFEDMLHGGWFELWIGSDGECVVQPIPEPLNYFPQLRGETFACGQLSALVLVERYLHTGTFDPPVLAPPTPAPEPFDTLI